jgi:hypothetical protein
VLFDLSSRERHSIAQGSCLPIVDIVAPFRRFGPHHLEQGSRRDGRAHDELHLGVFAPHRFLKVPSERWWTMAPRLLFDVVRQEPTFVANSERRRLGLFSRPRRMAASCLGIAVMACCLSPICFAADPSPKISGATAAAGDFLIGEPVKCENLSVFPVATKDAHDDDRFITLDEGLRAGTVRVFEIGAANAASGAHENSADRSARANARQEPAQRPVQSAAPAQAGGTAGQQPTPPSDSSANSASRRRPERDEVQGDVNRLVLKNDSLKPLYLMPGEIIVGGKQDRTIAEETIIKPGTKPVPIDVFCVEHGRWSGRAAAETAVVANALGGVGRPVAAADSQRIAEEAKSGQLNVGGGALSKQSRLAAQGTKSQREVWSEVSKANSLLGNASASGAYTGNYVQPDIVKKLEPYQKQLEKPVSDRDHVVGVIVAINGKLELADIFESTPLFRKLWPKLLKSYALDAAQAAKSAATTKTCSVDDAKTFLNDVLKAKVDKTETARGLVVSTRSTRGLTSFSANELRSDGKSPAVEFSRAVHSSVFTR